MKISIWCIGKTKDNYIQEGISVLLTKSKRYWDISWEEIEGIKYKSKDVPSFIQQAEEEVILKKLRPKSTLLLLDENGKRLDSTGFAKELQSFQDQQGIQDLVFVIGGAYGFSPEIKQKATILWSLSPLTFTHQMVRLVVLEQLFRSGTILRGEDYHH